LLVDRSASTTCRPTGDHRLQLSEVGRADGHLGGEHDLVLFTAACAL